MGVKCVRPVIPGIGEGSARGRGMSSRHISDPY